MQSGSSRDQSEDHLQTGSSKRKEVLKIDGPPLFRMQWLSDKTPKLRVNHLAYGRSGDTIMALLHNGSHKLWMWPLKDRTTPGRATARVNGHLIYPEGRGFMTNQVSDNPHWAIHSFVMTSTCSHIVTTSGVGYYVFHFPTMKQVQFTSHKGITYTCFAFHPECDELLAIGTDRPSISICKFDRNKGPVMIQHVLRGSHKKIITGLSFSTSHKILVSASGDSVFCLWEWTSFTEWRLIGSRPMLDVDIEMDFKVQFHRNQKQFLTFCEIYIAIFDAMTMELFNERSYEDETSMISHATFSCDGELIYISFVDGNVEIWDAFTLEKLHRISPASYLPAAVREYRNLCGYKIHPIVLAAHPSERNQFALGLNIGQVVVLEPYAIDGNW